MKKFQLTATNIPDVPAGLYEDWGACSARIADMNPSFLWLANGDATGIVRNYATGAVIGFGAVEIASNHRPGDARVVLYRFGDKFVAETNGDQVEVTAGNLHAASALVEMDHTELAGLIGVEDWDGYVIACRLFPAGSRVYGKDALGEAFGRRYDDHEEAQAVLERLQGAADRADNGYTFTLL